MKRKISRIKFCFVRAVDFAWLKLRVGARVFYPVQPPPYDDDKAWSVVYGVIVFGWCVLTFTTSADSKQFYQQPAGRELK